MKTISTFTSSKFALKIAALAIVMSAAVGNARAQGNMSFEDEISQYRWGIKGGINQGYQNSDKGLTDARTGIHLGGFMETTIKPKTDLQVEFVYSMQGCLEDGVEDQMDYINIPVIFKYHTNMARTFSIDFGPQVGYMLSAKRKKSSSTVEYDLNKITKLDVSACVGISYRFNPDFFASFRVNVGLTKIWQDLTYTNAVAQIGVGYIF